MTDWVEINGSEIPVEAWKYVIHSEGTPGLDEYPTIQYKNAERDLIERQIDERPGLSVSDFEPLVSFSDVERVMASE